VDPALSEVLELPAGPQGGPGDGLGQDDLFLVGRVWVETWGRRRAFGMRAESPYRLALSHHR